MALDVIGSDLLTAKSRFTTQKQVTTTQLSGYRTRSRDLPAYPRESIRLYTTDHWSFLQWCHPLKMLQNLRILHLHTTGYRDWPPAVIVSDAGGSSHYADGVSIYHSFCM
jgi:hypothetical protein